MSQPAPNAPHAVHADHADHADHAQGGISLGVVFYAMTAVFGLVNLFLGFAPATTGDSGSASYYDLGVIAWIPALLFLGGLLAARAVLPSAQRPDLLPALVTTAVVIPFIFSIMRADNGLATADVLFLIFGLIQLVTAWLGAALGAFRIGSIQVQRYPAPPNPVPPNPAPPNPLPPNPVAPHPPTPPPPSPPTEPQGPVS